MQLEGAHVVVTGAASGIGAALADRFEAQGARAVVRADVQSHAGVLSCDVSKESDLVALIDGAETKNGPIDLFCSNAGILGGFGFAEISDDEWRQTFDVNVMAHIWAARHLVPRMVERGGGYILNTASAAGLLTQIGAA